MIYSDHTRTYSWTACRESAWKPVAQTLVSTGSDQHRERWVRSHLNTWTVSITCVSNPLSSGIWKLQNLSVHVHVCGCAGRMVAKWRVAAACRGRSCSTLATDVSCASSTPATLFWEATPARTPQNSSKLSFHVSTVKFNLFSYMYTLTSKCVWILKLN